VWGPALDAGCEQPFGFVSVVIARSCVIVCVGGGGGYVAAQRIAARMPFKAKGTTQKRCLQAREGNPRNCVGLATAVAAMASSRLSKAFIEKLIVSLLT
jgi:hypothetical protein